MITVIRNMTFDDKTEVVAMMTEFYSSPAVHTNGSQEIFSADFDNCINDSPYLEGFVFEVSGEVKGYAMIAKSFSTEFGKKCIWIEDVYIKKEYRGLGIGKKFFDFLEHNYTNCIFRLEVEEDNVNAVNLYKKSGFEFMPYAEMKK